MLVLVNSVAEIVQGQLDLGPIPGAGANTSHRIAPFRSVSLSAVFTLSQRGLNGPDEQRVVKRLAKESHGASRQRLRPHRTIIVRGDKDDRNFAARAAEAGLNLDAIHVRHLHVQHHAIRTEGRQRFDQIHEFSAAAECFGGHAERTNEALQRAADGFVIVDNDYEWWLCSWHFLPATREYAAAR